MIADKIINYRELIDRSTQGFIGRRWVGQAVDAFLAAAGPRARSSCWIRQEVTRVS